MIISRVNLRNRLKFGVACDRCGVMLSEMRYSSEYRARRSAVDGAITARRGTRGYDGIAMDFCGGCVNAVPPAGLNAEGIRRNCWQTGDHRATTIFKIDGALLFSTSAGAMLCRPAYPTTNFAELSTWRIVGGLFPTIRRMVHSTISTQGWFEVYGALQKGAQYAYIAADGCLSIFQGDSRNLESVSTSIKVAPYFRDDLLTCLTRLEVDLSETAQNIEEMFSKPAETVMTRKLYL